MAVQRFNNHTRFYPPHHFVFYPLSIILIAIITYKAVTASGTLSAVWWCMALLLILIVWLSFMLRQHYALTLQNRLILVETRLRYYMLTHKNFEEMEAQLSFRQIAALRFASDEEFIPLLHKTLKENTDPKTIKQSIKNWKADYRRV